MGGDGRTTSRIARSSRPLRHSLRRTARVLALLGGGVVASADGGRVADRRAHVTVPVRGWWPLRRCGSSGTRSVYRTIVERIDGLSRDLARRAQSSMLRRVCILRRRRWSSRMPRCVGLRDPFDGMPRASARRRRSRRESTGVPLRQGTAQMRAVIEFARWRGSDRPGESLSRVSMLRRWTAGAAACRLALRGASGRSVLRRFLVARSSTSIGEFDGRRQIPDAGVPARADARGGSSSTRRRARTTSRAAGHGVMRWDWDVAVSPRSCAAHCADRWRCSDPTCHRRRGSVVDARRYGGIA